MSSLACAACRVLLVRRATADEQPGALSEFLSSDCEVDVVEASHEELRTSSGALVRSELAPYDLVWIDSTSRSAHTSDEVPLGVAALVVAASAHQTPVASSSMLSYQHLSLDVIVVESGAAAIDRLLDGSTLPAPSRHLDHLQRYYKLMARVRDYGTTEAQDALLLLTEEIGELAHAIRKHLNFDRKHAYGKSLAVTEELADIQLFLLHIANVLGASLGDAVCEKERINHARAMTGRRAQGSGPTRFLAIEGLIGAGKTTATRLVCERLGLEGVYEHATGYPFIESFYTDRRRNALDLELTFILLRRHAIRACDDDVAVVADFSPFKDILFSQLLLEDTDYDVVSRTYEYLWRDTRLPDLAIFIDLDPAEALRRIDTRGRAFERTISIDYLERLHDAYVRNLDQLADTVIRLPIEPDTSPDEVAARIVAEARARGYELTRDLEGGQ